MGITLEVQTILVLTIVALFFIYQILYKKDKRIAGFAMIVLGISLSGLTAYMSNIGSYILASVFILIGIGIYIFLDGAINHEKK